MAASLENSRRETERLRLIIANAGLQFFLNLQE